MEKKNRSMRSASVLLVLVLVTICLLAGTYAKYTTSGTGTDNARVAKWGVTITGGSGLFSKYYDEDETKATVYSSSGAKVVAPGTSGSMTPVSISGSPEVAVEINFNATLTLENWTVDGGFYCPLIFKVGGTTINGAEYTSAEAISDAINKEVAKNNNKLLYGTDLSTNVTVPTITWTWNFNDKDVENAYQQNAKDTALGDAAKSGPAPTIKLDVSATVSQVD